MSYERILLGVLAVVFCAGAGICFGEPVIVVEPSELNFSALERGSNPAAQHRLSNAEEPQGNGLCH